MWKIGLNNFQKSGISQFENEATGGKTKMDAIDLRQF